jgi:methionyl-tRNA formyltransferase
LLPPAVKTAAEALGLPVLQPPTLRRPEVVADLTALAPELIVVAAYGQILRPAVLAIPPHGVLNVHASLLPRWRGASPVTAAIAAGDERTGVSIMLMDEGLDTGPVLAVRETPITDHDTGGSLTERLANIGAELLAQTVPRWLAGAITPRPQDDAHATYAPRLEKSAGLIDWREPARVIWRKVRAYTPWPGAFTEYDGDLLRISSAWPLTERADGDPGRVVPLPSHAPAQVPTGLGSPAFAVVTGDGLLAPLTLQRAGRRALPAAEFLRGERGLIGGRLGDGAV